MDDEQVRHSKELLRIHRWNLRSLEQQAALHGFANIPVRILNEIRFERAAIRSLEAELHGCSLALPKGLCQQDGGLNSVQPVLTPSIAITICLERGNKKNVSFYLLICACQRKFMLAS